MPSKFHHLDFVVGNNEENKSLEWAPMEIELAILHTSAQRNKLTKQLIRWTNLKDNKRVLSI